MTTSTLVRTAKIKDRRSVRFGRLEDILADVQMLDDHVAGGRAIRTTGNWTEAQIVDHVASMIGMSLDEIPAKAPMLLRLFGPMLKNAALNRPMRPGFRIPRSFNAIAPKRDVTWDEAVQHLRALMKRIDDGERMTVPSPVLGPLNHEQWSQLHCRHAEMHFSFMHPD